MTTTHSGAAGELPARIGPFRILRLLGEGGMGRVFLAEQDEPARRVALKVLRAVAPGEARLRFAREIELLAALEHPNIARVYAAGTASDAGGELPYLAMEYIEGADLAVAARTLDLAQRIALLARICRAVHYAHTRGVIHRDLKPGNILVDAAGEPKVLDFGVASVLGEEQLTRMTAAGQILGTLPYMSWEQLTGEARVPDPRTDVYSLGVIAYELVAGRLPYPDLAKSTLITAIETVRTSDPPRLSRLARDATGDLETVIAKAMAREASQRYASAAELAADLERWLEHRPIEARPPTARYVLSLFVRRHRALTAAAVAVLFAVIAGAVVSLAFALQARERAAELTAVNQFLQDMFAAADPEHALGEKLTVQTVVDTARRQLDDDRTLATPVVAQLRQALGTTYISLGAYPQGLKELQTALDALTRERGALSDAALDVKLKLIRAYEESGHEAEAHQLLDPLVPQLQTARGARRWEIEARLEQANLANAAGKTADAEKILRALIPDSEQTLGLYNDTTDWALYELGLVLEQQDRGDDALVTAKLCLERMLHRLPPDHPRVQYARNLIALIDRDQGKFKDAEALYRQTIASREKTLGADHPVTQQARLGLAVILAMDGRGAEALPIGAPAYDGIVRALGPDAGATVIATNLMAYIARKAGDHAKALEMYGRLVTAERAKPGGLAEGDLPDLNGYGLALQQLKRLPEAKASFDELLARADALGLHERPSYAVWESNDASVLMDLGALAPARARLEHALPILKEKNGPAHPQTRAAAERLATVYRKLGRNDLAASVAPAAAP